MPELTIEMLEADKRAYKIDTVEGCETFFLRDAATGYTFKTGSLATCVADFLRRENGDAKRMVPRHIK